MIDPDSIQENGRMEVTIYPTTFPDDNERSYKNVTRSSMGRLENLTYNHRVTVLILRYPTIFIRNERK
jgi:hypothetical protein